MLSTWFFLISGIGCIYALVIYPCILMLLPQRSSRSHRTAATNDAKFSVVICARNEEHDIREKLVNTLEAVSGYEGSEILVVSDASTDSTDSIVGSFKRRGVVLLSMEQRKGKEAAQAAALEQARGEIIVFTDVATRIKRGSFAAMLECFSDKEVGAVSSRDGFFGAGSGEGVYVQYEMLLRKLESSRGGLVGLSGSFFAARRDVCSPWRIDVPSDFSVALNCQKQGLRAVHCDEMIGQYKDLADPDNELERKRRTVLRGMTALSESSDLLSFRKAPLFAFQIWSHKVLRWLTPWFLVAFLVASAIEAKVSVLAEVTLIIQIVFYCFAVMARFIKSLRQFKIFRLPLYFVETNVAMGLAGVDFLMGKKIVTWEPSKR